MINIKKIKLFLLVMLVCFISVLSISCTKDENKITVCEVTHSVFYAPLYAAIELGYFEEVGLTIDLVNGNGADKVMAALLSGDAQIGLMGPEASIYVYEQGQTNYAVNFAQLTRTDGSFIVGRENVENFTLSMLSGKSILGGRKGGVPEMTLEYSLRKSGLVVGQDDSSVLSNGGVLVRTDVAFAAMAGAFVSGEADYTTLFEPTATQLVNEGKGYILTSVSEYAGDVPYTAFSALKNYISKNEDIIQKFTDAIYKAQKWVITSSEDVVAQKISSHFPDISISDLTTVMKRYKDINAWNSSPLFTEKSLNNLMDIMIQAKELEKYSSYSHLVTTKYATNSMNK